MATNVLVAVDGSPASRQAAAYASDRFPDATLTLLYVMDPALDFGRRRALSGYIRDQEFETEREKADHVLESVQESIPAGIAVDTEIWAGDPARAIVEFADTEDVDHVVIGSHGRRGVARYLLGSVAETVVRRAAVPVTVVRPGEE